MLCTRFKKQCLDSIPITRSSYICVSVRQWPGRPEFNPSWSHTRDRKNSTWYLLASLSIISYVSRLKLSNLGKGVSPYSTPYLYYSPEGSSVGKGHWIRPMHLCRRERPPRKSLELVVMELVVMGLLLLVVVNWENYGT